MFSVVGHHLADRGYDLLTLYRLVPTIDEQEKLAVLDTSRCRFTNRTTTREAIRCDGQHAPLTMKANPQQPTGVVEIKGEAGFSLPRVAP